MPKEMEMKLMREAHKKGMTGKRADRYVYGTMNKMGMMNEHSPLHVKKRDMGMKSYDECCMMDEDED